MSAAVAEATSVPPQAAPAQAVAGSAAAPAAAAPGGPRLVVVIVNYRTAGLTVDCLASLAPEVARLPGTRVIVTDNLSGDDSVDRIGAAIRDRAWHDWATVMPLPKNGGFAYGNNEAIRAALAGADRPQYVLLLNPDTLVRPKALEALVEFMDRHPDVGIAGSRLEDPDGTPQRSAFRFHSVVNEFEGGLRFGPVSRVLTKHVVAPDVSAVPVRTDWVAGASMIVRRDVFEAVGLLDEQYFMYFEEVDFCLRASRAGFPCWYVPDSRVVHLVGQASGVTDPTRRRKRRPAYWFESRRRYFVKNFGRTYAAAADAAFMASFATWRARRKVQGKPDTDPDRMLGDFAQHSVFAKGFSPSPTLPLSPPTERPLSLRALIREDWIAHGRDWTRPGFRAVAVYRFGVWRMTVRNKFLRAPLSIVYRAMFRHVRNVYGIELPYSAKVGRRVIFEHQHGIVVHGNCVIGDDSIVRQGVTLGNKSLDRPFDAPVLGSRVNVGAGAKILGAVRIGDGAAIGANAVVLSDVPAGAIAVGIPAKVVRGGGETAGKAADHE